MVAKEKTIGILALQGDFEKHRSHLVKSKTNTKVKTNIKTKLIRYPEQLAGIDGLVIPGGESTTIGKLMERSKLLLPLKQKIRNGLPVFGTCAGCIILARDIIQSNQLKLGVLDIAISRNAYGRQVESFEADISFPILGIKSTRCIFIRAPIIKQFGKRVQVLGELNERPILIRQHNILACTFHPELTCDIRIHTYFLDMIN